MIATLARYFHTVRHMRPVQITARLARMARRPRPPRLAGPATLRQLDWQWPEPARLAASMTGPDSFTFLNRPGRVAASQDWDDEGVHTKLWLYNLHYFDDLNALGSPSRLAWHEQIVARWIAENPPGQGTGWEPYPTSLRISNWVKWIAAGNWPSEAMLGSLALQSVWLRANLEWHLLGNHLFANGKALVLAGLCLSGPDAARALSAGLLIIDRELPEQLLADGGNFERSPMYHAIFLADLLDLLGAAHDKPGLVGAERIDCWRTAASAMLSFLRGVTHGDGDIALFNDAAIGIAPGYADLAGYAERLGIRADAPATGLTVWPETGMIRIDDGAAMALLDVGPVGPDYLPGHAHADTLSFELSRGTQRIVVNGGTSEYGTGPVRQAERATRAHSTVELDDRNSSEVWGGFRVARRARVRDLTVREGAGTWTVSAAHDGYRRLPGRPLHRRTWHWAGGSVTISDRVEGGGAQMGVARFHLHPDIAVEPTEPATFILRAASRVVATVIVVKGDATLAASHYAPEFGVRVPTTCLEVRLCDGAAEVAITWADGVENGGND